MIELFSIFVDNIVPILIVAALGYVVGKQFEIDPRSLNRILLYVLSPTLVFKTMSTSEIGVSEMLQIALVTVVFVGLMGWLAYIVAGWYTNDFADRSAIIVGAICPNGGNFGLPLISFAFGSEIFSRALVIYVIVTLLNYTAGIYVASGGYHNARQALMNVIRIPTIYMALAGLVVNILNIDIPSVLERPITLLSGATVPIMIILLGVQLAGRTTQFTQIKLLATGVVLRLLASPLIATFLALLFNLNGAASVAIVMQASMPTAVVTIIFATEFGLDRQLSLGLILVSTLFSPITLSVLIYILRNYNL